MTTDEDPRPLVLVTRCLPEAWIESLHEHARVMVGSEGPGLDDDLRAALPEASGILSLLTEPIDADLLDAAPNLKVVSNMAVGVDNIDVAACRARGVAVGNTPGVLTEATADLTMALILAASRRLPQAIDDARAGRWTTWSPTGWLGRDLLGATLGVVGLGQIGRAVARRARAFGMSILYTSRSPRPEAAAQLGARQVELSGLLAVSDIVSLHVPLTEDTRHLIDAAALRSMKTSALLINTARGPVVDNDALLDAVRSGQIAGAALDVTDPEPLPAAHPMYAEPNLLVAPHIGSATEQTRRRMAELACRNLIAGLRGEALPHPV